jgi:hypothetical protein
LSKRDKYESIGITKINYKEWGEGSQEKSNLKTEKSKINPPLSSFTKEDEPFYMNMISSPFFKGEQSGN